MWLSEVREHQVAEAVTSDDFLAQLETTPTGNQSAFVYERVENHALYILVLKSSTRFVPRQPFQVIGLDSLMAVELRNALGNCVQQELPTTLLFEYGTLQDLTDYLCETLQLGEPSPSVESTEPLEEDIRGRKVFAQSWINAIRTTCFLHIHTGSLTITLLRRFHRP